LTLPAKITFVCDLSLESRFFLWLIMDTLIRTLQCDMHSWLWLAICPLMRLFLFDSQSLVPFEICILIVNFAFIRRVCFDSHCSVRLPNLYFAWRSGFSLASLDLIHSLCCDSGSFVWFIIFTFSHIHDFHSRSLLWFTNVAFPCDCWCDSGSLFRFVMFVFNESHSLQFQPRLSIAWRTFICCPYFLP
jgi:hypothetical protein